MSRHKKEIKVKIAVVTCLATAVFTVGAMALTYFYISVSFRDNAVRSQLEMADQAASSITAILDKEIELAKVVALAPSMGKALALSAQSSVDAPSDGVDTMLMRPLAQEGIKVLGAILTDTDGALVASTGTGREFYEANEKWWRGAFESVKTSGLIGDVVSEKISDTWAVPFVAPVRDANLAPIGMLGIFVDVSIFFKPLSGAGGVNPIDAYVVDDKGYIIYRSGTVPFSCKFCSHNELQQLLQSPRKWRPIRDAYLQKEPVLAAFAGIDHPRFAADISAWKVIVVKPLADIFQPIKSITMIMMLSALALIFISFFVALVFGEVLMRPVMLLHDGIRRIGLGDLGHKIELKTNDEIEELADSINDMAASLTKTTTSISALEIETALRRKAENIRLDIIAMVSRLKPSLETINSNIRKFLSEAAGRLGDKEKSLLGPACDEIDKVSAGIKNLADIAGIEAGREELKLVPIDIKTILRKNLFAFEPRIRGKGLELKLETPRGETMVNADAAKIISAFNILIEYALKSTEKGHIRISVKDERDAIECSVSYTGVGMPEAELDGIFNNAGQAAAPLRGAALDLSVVKEIINIHNGKIRAECIPGKEPSFIFTLPKHKS